MAVLVTPNTRVTCQAFTGSQGTSLSANVFSADNLSDAALKIAKAVKR